MPPRQLPRNDPHTVQNHHRLHPDPRRNHRNRHMHPLNFHSYHPNHCMYHRTLHPSHPRRHNRHHTHHPDLSPGHPALRHPPASRPRHQTLHNYIPSHHPRRLHIHNRRPDVLPLLSLNGVQRLRSVLILLRQKHRLSCPSPSASSSLLRSRGCCLHTPGSASGHPRQRSFLLPLFPEYRGGFSPSAASSYGTRFRQTFLQAVRQSGLLRPAVYRTAVLPALTQPKPLRPLLPAFLFPETNLPLRPCLLPAALPPLFPHRPLPTQMLPLHQTDPAVPVRSKLPPALCALLSSQPRPVPSDALTPDAEIQVPHPPDGIPCSEKAHKNKKPFHSCAANSCRTDSNGQDNTRPLRSNFPAAPLPASASPQPTPRPGQQSFPPRSRCRESPELPDPLPGPPSLRPRYKPFSYPVLRDFHQNNNASGKPEHL